MNRTTIIKWARALVLPIILVGTAVLGTDARAVGMGGWQLVPVPGTLRTDATPDMLWQVTADDGEQWQQRFAVTGCAEGHGALYMVEDDYSLTTSEGFAWTRGGELGAVAAAICGGVK